MKAVPLMGGTLMKNFSSASKPPAEQPMPMMGKDVTGDGMEVATLAVGFMVRDRLGV